MKKILVSLLIIALLLPLVASADDETDTVRTLLPNEQYLIRTELKGEWISNAPEIAEVDDGGLVTALSEGEAAVTLSNKGKTVLTRSFRINKNPDVPAEINDAIDLAVSEWEIASGSGFKRNNKYTIWYCGPNAIFGWCGAFTSYSLGEAGVPQAPTDTYSKLTPLPDGQPYGVREAGVPKLLTGYTNLDRTTNIPRPGYLVIYGDRGGYKTKHVGLVTRVEDRGDGVYLLETVEGNLSSRIKRLTYLYDSKTKDPQRNMSMLPEDEQTNSEIFQYRLSSEDWRVTAFAQTWY